MSNNLSITCLYVCLFSEMGGRFSVGRRRGDKRPGKVVVPRYLIWKGLMDGVRNEQMNKVTNWKPAEMDLLCD